MSPLLVTYPKDHSPHYTSSSKRWNEQAIQKFYFLQTFTKFSGRSLFGLVVSIPRYMIKCTPSGAVSLAGLTHRPPTVEG